MLMGGNSLPVSHVCRKYGFMCLAKFIVAQGKPRRATVLDSSMMAEVLGRNVGYRCFVSLRAYDTVTDITTAKRCECIIVRIEASEDQVVIATPGALACSGGRWDPTAAARINGIGVAFHRVPLAAIRSATEPSWSTDIVLFENPPTVAHLLTELADLSERLGNTDTDDAAPRVKSSGKSSSIASSWDPSVAASRFAGYDARERLETWEKKLQHRGRRG